MRFPAIAITSLPRETSMLVAEMTRLLAEARWTEGYLRIHAAAGDDHVLFVHQGKAHFAGAIEDDRFVSCSFLDVFDAIPHAKEADYCATDPSLLLSIAVPFRKAPSAHLEKGTVSGASLATAIEKSMLAGGGRDAVLTFRRGESVSFLLYRAGTPGWLYPAPGEKFPDGATAGERIAAYVAAFPDVSTDVYNEVVLPAAAGAGKPFAAYADEASARALIPVGLVPSIAVSMGTRLMYRYVMDRDEIRIGRGGDNDLALDNLTVSRSHATMTRKGDGLLVTDLGSENGILQGAKRVKEVLLKPGERVEIGKYTLLYDHYAPKVQAAQNRPAKGPRSVEETLGIVDASFRSATFRCGNDAVKMSGMVFHIGKGDDAHLKISGLFVAPIHVRVIRDSSGVFRAEHVGGGRGMTINGKTEMDVILKHGDEIEIAGNIVRFEISVSSPKSSIGPR